MKKLLLGLMLLATAGGANAEWTRVDENHVLTQYVDIITIRRNGNLVKMWEMSDYKTVQTVLGDSYLSDKTQSEYDCKEERVRILAFTWFDGKMGRGNPVYNRSDTEDKWQPIQPASLGKSLWKIACGKK